MLLALYLAVGLGWTINACFKQLTISNNTTKLIITGFLNFVGWPVAMYLAYNKDKQNFVK